MHRIAVVAAVAAVAAFMLTPAPGQAVDIQYVTGPGGQFVGYTAPALVVRAGDTVTYTNADVAAHDVVADVLGPDRPWCALAGFAPGQCPLVWSPLIGLGKSVPVYGVVDVAPGQQVTFHCSIHANMHATLVALPV